MRAGVGEAQEYCPPLPRPEGMVACRLVYGGGEGLGVRGSALGKDEFVARGGPLTPGPSPPATLTLQGT